MVNKNKNLIYAGIIILVLVFVFIVLRFLTPEDTWIKDKNGFWIKHGNPSTTPDEVLQQQEAIKLANELYYANSARKVIFNSQCLGTVHLPIGVGYAVDIVHVPRIPEDDLKENQCSSFFSGEAEHFIELNSKGEIVRIG